MVSCFCNVPFFGLSCQNEQLVSRPQNDGTITMLCSITATLKYGRHIKFVLLSPGLLQVLSFHMQKHGLCKAFLSILNQNFPRGACHVLHP